MTDPAEAAYFFHHVSYFFPRSFCAGEDSVHELLNTVHELLKTVSNSQISSFKIVNVKLDEFLGDVASQVQLQHIVQIYAGVELQAVVEECLQYGPFDWVASLQLQMVL